MALAMYVRLTPHDTPNLGNAPHENFVSHLRIKKPRKRGVSTTAMSIIINQPNPNFIKYLAESICPSNSSHAERQNGLVIWRGGDQRQTSLRYMMKNCSKKTLKV